MYGGLRTKGKGKASLPHRPLITVVTVVYNGADHLEQAILSVLNQSYANIEYCIIDGGSTDGTLDIIRKYDDQIDYWVSEADQGIYDAMNKGIYLAHGDLIGLLNADDFYDPDAVRVIVDSYQANGAPHGIIYGHNYILQDDLGILYTFNASLHFWRGMPICHQAMFVHRECYRDVGVYDQRYQLAADLDFLLRSIRKGVQLIPVDKVIVTFRAAGLSVTNPFPLIRENSLVIIRYFGVLNGVFLKFVLLCLRDIPLLLLKYVLLKIVGSNAMLRLRKRYTRLFISRGKEV